MSQKVAILGSTGSIGVQSLDVIRHHREHFTPEILTANDNWELLARQAIEFQPAAVVIANEGHYDKLTEALKGEDIKVYAGADAVEQVAAGTEIDTVINSLVGFAGLRPTISAIKAGKKIALANKETLVVAGELITALSREYKAPILPVDSEHSAIFQCLAGEVSPPARIIITASGGALRDYTPEQLTTVTPAQALKHPNWEMGAKITIDSATMANKGFEVIEAKWLFGLEPSQIEVVIHPQSIIHSFVEFADGSVKAQMGIPDMRLPIQYALTYPHRLELQNANRYDPTMCELTFTAPDHEKYPCLALAYIVMEAGGNMPCVMNAANEVAVAAFLEGKIKFTSIYEIIDSVIQSIPYQKPGSFDEIYETDRIARYTAEKLITN